MKTKRTQAQQTIFPFDNKCEPTTTPVRPRLPKERRLAFAYSHLQEAIIASTSIEDKKALAYASLILASQQYTDLQKEQNK
jgi:hypothetical protein